ncbi:nitroreductase family protein [Dyella koreensis]|uniref:Nitroreductase family protein n=1 Tax=Dyella koreensis TaxID=311235 RepID=A0ABW8K9J0_9GAMM
MIFVAELQAREDSIDTVHALLADLARTTAAEDGALAYSVRQHLDDPTRFQVSEHYRDHLAFEQHMASPPVQHALARFAELLRAPPAVARYEEKAALPQTQGVTLSVADAIRQRRAARHYRPDAVDPRVLDELIELTLAAPSSWNLQDRQLVIITSEGGRQALAHATGGQSQPQEAPVMVVFLADCMAHARDRSDIVNLARTNGAWNETFANFFAAESQSFQEALAARGALREYAIKDAMIAASFFMLAAQSRGLATSPMNGWDEALVKRAIGAEQRDDPAVALLVSLGYAAEQPLAPGRRPATMNVFRERVPD